MTVLLTKPGVATATDQPLKCGFMAKALTFNSSPVAALGAS